MILLEGPGGKKGFPEIGQPIPFPERRLLWIPAGFFWMVLG